MDIVSALKVFVQEPIVLYVLMGYFVGFFFGAVPGLTATLAISLLLPLTFGMEPLSALVTCVGIFIGGIYGGGVTGILINIPGAPAAAITSMEGFQLTLKGQAAKAMAHAAFASMVGGMVGAVMTILLINPMAELSLFFKTPDKFSLILMAVVTAMLLNSTSILKGMVATILGLMIATIGLDYFATVPRITLGFSTLIQGVNLLTVVVGTFAVAEILSQLDKRVISFADKVKSFSINFKMRDFLPPLKEIREIGFLTYFRSSVLGFFTGILPGAGAAMAALLSYSLAKTFSRRKAEYDHGSVEGIAAAETANNAMCPGAIIPLVIFGIPGDAVTAVILGVFIIHGLIPGPLLFVERAHLLGPMMLSLLITPLLIVITVFFLGKHYIRILSIRRELLYPFIGMAAIVGLYAATYSTFQLVVTLVIGVLVYLLKTEGYPPVPVLLGFILGPLLERYFRSSMRISGGDMTVFLTSPLSLTFLILIVVFAYFLGYKLPKILEASRK